MFTVVPAGPLVVSGGLAWLGDQAVAEGIRVVDTLVSQWLDGSERFDRPGEGLLAAVSEESAVGVGGLSWCPDVAGALRMRRFYVSPAWRRHGVAAALATALVTLAFEHADVITCNAQASPAAPVFWERMGFVPVDDVPGVTHVRRR